MTTPPSQLTAAEVEGAELGSAYSPGSRLFEWDRGEVFSTPPLDVSGLEEMMSRDGTVRSVEQVLTLPLRSATWQIVQPQTGEIGQTEFVQQALDTLPAPIGQTVAQVCAATLFRRSYHEKVFTVTSGKLTYAQLAWRPPSTCWLNRDKETAQFAGFTQRTWKGDSFIDVDIPAARSMVYVHGRHRDPINGTSDLDVCWTAYQSKQKLRFLWYAFLENQVIPKTVAKVSSNDHGRAHQLAVKAATLKGGGVIGLTDDESLTPFEGNGSGATVFEAAIAYLDTEMTGSVIAGFLNLLNRSRGTSGNATTGSNALSESAMKFFTDNREGVLREMEDTLTSQLIRPLVVLNFGAAAAVPKWKFAPLDEESAAAIIPLAQALATAPHLNVAPVLVDELSVKLATLLDLDASKVTAALAAGPSPAEAATLPAGTPAGQQVAVAAHRATQAVQAAAAGRNPAPALAGHP